MGKPKKLRKMWDAIINALPVIITSVIAIGAVLAFATKDALITLYSAKVEGTPVNIDAFPRVMVLVLIAFLVAVMVLMSTMLNGVSADAKAQKKIIDAQPAAASARVRDQREELRAANAAKELAKAKAEAEATAKRLAEAARREAEETAKREAAAVEKRIQDKVSELEGRQFTVERTLMRQEKVLLARRRVTYESVGDTDDTEFHLIDDKTGGSRLVLVAHLFRNTAFWLFDSKTAFENKDHVEFGFMRGVERSKLPASWKRFDHVIGVGLNSKTKNHVPDMAYRRAANFCGQLNAIIGRDGQPGVWGLSIGDYTGPEVDTTVSPQPYQRTALILGVTKEVEGDVAEQQLVEEILQEVGIPGIDLRKYSGFKPGGKLQWLELKDCDPNPTF